jgi:hypothetical protein
MNEETFTPFYISNAYFFIIADVLQFNDSKNVLLEPLFSIIIIL